MVLAANFDRVFTTKLVVSKKYAIISIMIDIYKKSWALDLFFITLLIGGFYALFMGSHHLLVPDEGRYVEIAREMAANGNYITPFLNGIVFLDKPILFYWLECSAINLFGLSEWSLRLWPTIIGVFGCLATYITGRELFNRRTGIFATFILATSPLYYFLAHYTNMDLEVAVFITTSLYAFLIAINTEKSRSRSIFLWLSYIFAALAFLTKGMIGIVFPGMIIACWLTVFNNWKLLKKINLISGLIIFVLITAPWFILEQRFNPKFFHYFFVTQQFSRFLGSTFNNPQTPWFYLPVILIGFIPWTSFLGQALWQQIQMLFKNRNQHKNEVFLLFWALLVAIFFSIPQSKLIGYIVPVVPPLALIIAIYLDNAISSIKMSGIKTGLILWIIFTCCAIAALLYLPHLPINFNFNNVKIIRYLLIILLLCSSSIIGILWFTKVPQKWNTIIITLALTSALLLVISANNMSKFGLRSGKPLAMKINELSHGDEIVVGFYNYFYDVSVYIKKPLFMVEKWDNFKNRDDDDWRGMFMLTSEFNGSQKKWLITEEHLKKFWKNKKVFLIANKDYIPHLKKLLGNNLHFLDEHQKNVLMSNYKKYL